MTAWRSNKKFGLGASCLVVITLLLGGCSEQPDDEATLPISEPAETATTTKAETASPSVSASPAPTGEPTQEPLAIANYFDREYEGADLTLGEVRERAQNYTSYDATYRSGDLNITGVINVPTGDGPFPAVVLAHGWINRDSYTSGQGMTRERGYLANQGYIAFHIDYRNHAGSDDDPGLVKNMYLGFAVDAITAVEALRSSELPVASDQIALMGRSMGGSVVLQALEMAPELVSAGIVYSGQSSLEAENYERWGESTAGYATEVVDTYGTPAENPGFWETISTRPYFERITKPVLMIHGTEDEQCPEAWAQATFDSLLAADVDAEIEWYEGEHHTFEARFNDSMARSVDFLSQNLG